MNLSERMQIERYELGDADSDAALRARGTTAVALLTVVLAAIVGVLGYATVTAIDGWAHLVVIGGILTTAIGLMIAVAPNRRA